ncbi:MAG: hypothetical protein EOM92_14655 [Gammaproteobacteria bacterium]|nr:hypothetical protein [Gammaproteobacteria bacterium]
MTGSSLRRAGASILAGTLGTALFLSLFGYWGLVHDTRLYALQALAWLHPQLRQDLYLRFGSQDDYTLFSAFFTPLIQVLGLEGAALTLCLLSLLALFTATAYLLTRLTGAAGSLGGTFTAPLAGTLAVAMLPVVYSAMSIFHVAEPFATPRPLAAALGLLTIAWALERRWLPAALAAIAALLVHPLMAWPAVVLALWVGLRPRLAMMVTLLGALALILAAWAGAPILERLFQVMDPEWQAMTRAMAPYLWAATWDASDWNTAGVALLAPVVTAVALAGEGHGRTGRLFVGNNTRVDHHHSGATAHPLRQVGGYPKLALAASLLGATGLLATVLLGDGFNNLLSLQLQPWRALWLSHWLGVAGLGLVFIRALRIRDPADLSAVLGLAGAELLITGSGALILVVTLAVILVQRRVPRHCPSPNTRYLSPTTTRLLLGMMVAIFALGLGLNLQGVGLSADLGGLLLQQSAVVVLLATAGWLVARFVKTPRVRRVALAAGLVLIGVLVGTGVQRSLLLARGIGHGDDLPPPRLVDLPLRPGSILWEGTPLTLWYQWHHPSYMHTLQLTGSVFSREKLMAAQARIAHLEAVLGPLDLMNRETVSLDLPPPDQDQIARLCADPELAGIYYAGKHEMPWTTAGAGDEAVDGAWAGDEAGDEAETGSGNRPGGEAEAAAVAVAKAPGGGAVTLRNSKGVVMGILALCPGGAQPTAAPPGG